MNKQKIIGITLFFILGLFSLSFCDEQITITTYYPSPYGSYNELSVLSRQAIGDFTGDVIVNSNDMAVDDTGNPIPGSLTVAGKVGIGTTRPSYNSLAVNGHVYARNGVVVDEGLPAGCWVNPNSGYAFGEICFDTGMFSDHDGFLYLYSNGGGVMMVREGRVGIRTTRDVEPNATLHIVGGAGLAALRVDDSGAMNDPTPFVIDGANGNVGIGTASPTSKLQVVGLPIYADNTAATAGGLTVGAFYRTNGDPDRVCVVH